MAGAAAMLALVSCGPGPTSVPAPDAHDWVAYKARFIMDDGRVIDDAQQGVSHSESQGYGMLLAVAFDDAETFRRIWQWTRSHLQVRNDYLFAWLWDAETGQVADTNNATDGDVLIAWALLRAARHWSDNAYEIAGRQILKSLASLQVRVNGRVYLLPGQQGFLSSDKLVLNPSHFVLPAFREFADLDTSVDWQALYANGVFLIESSATGPWHLTPDWVDLRQGGRPWAEREPYFGYDAVRIPLYASWVGERGLLNAYIRLWRQFSMRELQPDLVDLSSGFVHLREGPSAVRAIWQLCEHVSGHESAVPSMDWEQGPSYYDASLYMLVRLAWYEFDLMNEQ